MYLSTEPKTVIFFFFPEYKTDKCHTIRLVPHDALTYRTTASPVQHLDSTLHDESLESIHYHGRSSSLANNTQYAYRYGSFHEVGAHFVTVSHVTSATLKHLFPSMWI